METVVLKKDPIYMENKPNSKNPWWQPGLQLFLQLSSWIVGPIIIAVIVGKYLDKKYGSEPWLFLLTVAIAFIISMTQMIRIGFKEFKKIEADAAREKLENEKKINNSK